MKCPGNIGEEEQLLKKEVTTNKEEAENKRTKNIILFKTASTPSFIKFLRNTNLIHVPVSKITQKPRRLFVTPLRSDISEISTYDFIKHK